MKPSRASRLPSPRGKRHNRICQPSCLSHYGNRSIAKTVELAQTTWLIPRRHHEHICSAFDTMGESFVESDTKSHTMRIACLERLQLGFELRLSCSECQGVGPHDCAGRPQAHNRILA